MQEKCCTENPEGCKEFTQELDNTTHRAILFGWSGCPCTGIAKKRFEEKKLCYVEDTYPNPRDPKMKYLMCQYGDSHHSFIFMRESKEPNAKWLFKKNGFFFDKKRMPDEELTEMCTTAGAEMNCAA